MKIGIFADTHYCTRPSLCENTRFPETALKRVLEACQLFAHEKADLIVSLGDLINVDDTPALEEQSLRAISAAMRQTGIPCVCVMGNHDREAFTREEFAEISGLTIAPHTIVAGDCALHFVDANNEEHGKPYQKRNLDWTKCYVEDNEIAALTKACQDGDKKHFFFFHQCVDPNAESHHLIANAAQLREIIHGCNAKAVFQGHYHNGMSSVVNGIPYETLSALCSHDYADHRLIDTDRY